MKSEFSQYLGLVRGEVGLSQNKLAQLAGLDGSHINRLESGARNKPKRDNLSKIAEALGLDEEKTSLLFIAAGYRPPATFNLTDQQAIEQMRRLQDKLYSTLANPLSKPDQNSHVSQGYGIFE